MTSLIAAMLLAGAPTANAAATTEAASSTAQTTAAPAANAGKKSRTARAPKVCKTIPITGSRTGARICKTQEEWNGQLADDGQKLESIDKSYVNNGG